ncbi:MAG: hypothetical protein H6Q89_4676, partial [Myxococcaceae bacterium]|nr:hypothetical protein [Myxococcaceae bacterium]
GTFQAFIVLGMAVFLPREVVNSSGIAFANLLWVVQIAQQVIVGLVLMTLSQRSFRGIAGKLEAEQASNA